MLLIKSVIIYLNKDFPKLDIVATTYYTEKRYTVEQYSRIFFPIPLKTPQNRQTAKQTDRQMSVGVTDDQSDR